MSEEQQRVRGICKECGSNEIPLNTATASTWVCQNCDQYPWVINPMTEQEVMDRDKLASRKAREHRG